jgi:hypothetical protein
MLSGPRRARFAGRIWLGGKPVVYRAVPAMNWLRHRDPVAFVPDGTALVIDGFPGSGNSFAANALAAAARAEGRELPPIAHHLHCARQVLNAADRGLPVLLLVREPVRNAVSAIARWPHLSAPVVLRAYAWYHEPLVPVADRLVVSTFDELTRDLGAVTRRVNERFDTDLPIFEHTPESAAGVYGPVTPERAARKELAARREPEVLAPELASLRERAQRRFGLLTGPAGK